MTPGQGPTSTSLFVALAAVDNAQWLQHKTRARVGKMLVNTAEHLAFKQSGTQLTDLTNGSIFSCNSPPL